MAISRRPRARKIEGPVEEGLICLPDPFPGTSSSTPLARGSDGIKIRTADEKSLSTSAKTSIIAGEILVG